MLPRGERQNRFTGARSYRKGEPELTLVTHTHSRTRGSLDEISYSRRARIHLHEIIEKKILREIKNVEHKSYRLTSNIRREALYI